MIVSCKEAQILQHLQNMNDVSLSAAASSKTGSEESTILNQSHNKSTESIDKYQLNQDDAWIKNSMQFEANPMSAIGGSILLAVNPLLPLILVEYVRKELFLILILNGSLITPRQ
jgi:hypothetical protein